MTTYNTASDAANTAVRSFLTSVGEHYLGRSFNTGIGNGKGMWDQIRNDFGNSCAYCGAMENIQIEHLVMFNRAEYGLHHPGNVVPVCKTCNKRYKDKDSYFVSWQVHLERICGGTVSPLYGVRHRRITEHIEKYKYPKLSEQERHAIRVIAESLYENIKSEVEKSLSMYRKLDQAFIKGTLASLPPTDLTLPQ